MCCVNNNKCSMEIYAKLKVADGSNVDKMRWDVCKDLAWVTVLKKGNFPDIGVLRLGSLTLDSVSDFLS